jgi:hypothetical protein
MSQTDTDATDESTDSNQTAEEKHVITERVTAMRERLESLETDELEEMEDFALVELRSELKMLEDKVSDVRKGQADDVLQERIDVGESLYGLSHIESHNKYVDEDVGTVIMRAVSAGVDYTEFVSVHASTLASDYPELADIGRSTYTYLR